MTNDEHWTRHAMLEWCRWAGPEHTIACINALWRAVITVCILEATRPADSMTRKVARRWLRTAPNYHLVCDMAGLDPTALLDSVEKKISKTHDDYIIHRKKMYVRQKKKMGSEKRTEARHGAQGTSDGSVGAGA